MIIDVGEDNVLDDDELESATEDDDLDIVSDGDTDNVGDMSIEINVDELVAKIEGRDGSDSERQREIRRRLEEVREQREAERELDSTFNFNLDDEF